MARGVWPAPSPDAQDQAPEDSAPGEASSTLGHERGPARASNSPTLRGRGAAHHWPHGSFQLQPRPPAAVSGRTPARLFVLLRVHSPRLGDRGRNRPGHVGTVTAQKPAGTQTTPTDIGRSDLAEGTHPDTPRCLATQNAGPGSHAGCFHKGGIAGNRLPTADPLVLRVCPPGNASKSETAV